jgi:mRNA interferase RelE/StbE
MYNIIFTRKSEGQLDKLDNSIRERIISSLERIRIRPENFVERLVGEPGYKFRIGDYRLILDINNDQLIILVIEIGHRRNIYKK